MKLLIIGNGYDIAHGLPTRYNEFLDFIDLYKEDYEKIFIVNGKINSKFCCDEVRLMVEENKPYICEEFYDLIQNNFWLKFFENKKSIDKWIDFEDEIERLLKQLIMDIGEYTEDISSHISNPFVSNFCSVKKIHTDKNLFKELEKELKSLNRILEIYIAGYVSKISIGDELSDIISLQADKVISYNYTRTIIDKYYSSDTDYSLIHGEAKIKNNILNNNMVLGFEDYYLDKKKQDSRLVCFQKYYQKIVKNTDNKYYEWIEIANKPGNFGMLEVYIFGHSLSPADGDVIKDFIVSPGTRTHIYYLDDEDKAEKVKNLAVILKADELIKRTNGKNKSIEFLKINNN